jgi:hypothetical protein
MNDTIIPKVDYIILCDSVSSSPEGKKTLYGLFDSINSKKFPCIHPSFFLLIRLINGMGIHRTEVQILDPHDKIIFKTDPLEIKLDNPLAGADFVIQLQGFAFPVQGTYRIKVLLNGKPVEEEVKSFQLNQV